MTPKYKLTVFKSIHTTVGTLYEKSLQELYFLFKNNVVRTREKQNEYLNMKSDFQLNCKDVGGYIGGVTEENRRSIDVKVKTRGLLVLDIDTDKSGVFEYLQRHVDFVSIIYSTHKHTPDQNRFRVISPFSREVSADEYEAVGRRIAYKIENADTEQFKGLFDETTFQAKRLMFFPSASSDAEYICEIINWNPFLEDDEQKVINVDEILKEYNDSNDIFEWFSPDKKDDYRIGKNTLINKKPLNANGFVGAFNRTYTISKAIETFLPKVYKKERNGRYTYVGGESYGGGLILNNDSIFYSHHGTDPANLYYRSAFDLVRIHKFGNYDNNFTPERELESKILEKSDSFAKMIDLCRALPEVISNSSYVMERKMRMEEQENKVNENFNYTNSEENKELNPEDIEIINGKDGSIVILEKGEIKSSTNVNNKQELVDNKEWVSKLESQKTTASKLETILENDNMVGKLLYYDTFRENICFLRKPYWQLPSEFYDGKSLQDKDTAHIRNYLEKTFEIIGDKRIEDAIVVDADKIKKNAILEYFESLQWDGKKRLEFFFHDFFKTPLNAFTRIAFKKWLVGAVSRIYKAGSPLDYLLIIKGKQGIGKSLFFKKLATIDFNKPTEHLYSDTKIDFDRAKDSYEQLEGIWIYEWKELAGMSMSEQESIKAFIDKTEDKFRRSYGRRNVEIKRRVAFGGSTNEKQPLRDRTGNRRFLVYESPLKQNECYIKDLTKFDQYYKDQMIAEAVVAYKSGFDIFNWTDEENKYWDQSNDENLAENDFLGSISNFISMKRPRSWYAMSEIEMKEYTRKYNFELDRPSDIFSSLGSTFLPEKVCLPELWRIALDQKDITINRFHRELIESACDRLGWNLTKERARFGTFGIQNAIRLRREEAKEEKPKLFEDDDLPF